jgi:hypothetical protein
MVIVAHDRADYSGRLARFYFIHINLTAANPNQWFLPPARPLVPKDNFPCLLGQPVEDRSV